MRTVCERIWKKKVYLISWYLDFNVLKYIDQKVYLYHFESENLNGKRCEVQVQKIVKLLSYVVYYLQFKRRNIEFLQKKVISSKSFHPLMDFWYFWQEFNKIDYICTQYL
eukprot:TRINITY_DN4453_c0_g1_i4.p6 TRINITY_DN4453_c0_g1~~TRINITY_DN4453_c0_g1_i4.p6  ORF type:complete len:110 (-),score=7.17 TRINITY_DN4453_c0_g1_i4:305-634(-)